jgi:hypothetical protein
MSDEKLTLIDADGNPLAELEVTAREDDWFTAKLLSQQFPPKLKDALAWYDEIIEGQMLSYLDRAADAVAQFNLRVRDANGVVRKVFSLHVNKQSEVSFRTSPVPPPAWLTKSASA